VRQPLERVHASPRVPLERPLPRPRRRARRAIRLESTRASRRVVLAARRHRARVGVCVDSVGTRGVATTSSRVSIGRRTRVARFDWSAHVRRFARFTPRERRAANAMCAYMRRG